jgi:hypothetical protein
MTGKPATRYVSSWFFASYKIGNSFVRWSIVVKKGERSKEIEIPTFIGRASPVRRPFDEHRGPADSDRMSNEISGNNGLGRAVCITIGIWVL